MELDLDPLPVSLPLAQEAVALEPDEDLLDPLGGFSGTAEKRMLYFGHLQ